MAAVWAGSWGVVPRVFTLLAVGCAAKKGVLLLQRVGLRVVVLPAVWHLLPFPEGACPQQGKSDFCV